jgi:hypothetical protein
VQVSSPYHKENPAASFKLLNRKVQVAEQFMSSEGNRQRQDLESSLLTEKTDGSDGAGRLLGMGSGMFARLGMELGRPSLTKTMSREKA